MSAPGCGLGRDRRLALDGHKHVRAGAARAGVRRLPAAMNRRDAAPPLTDRCWSAEPDCRFRLSANVSPDAAARHAAGLQTQVHVPDGAKGHRAVFRGSCERRARDIRYVGGPLSCEFGVHRRNGRPAAGRQCFEPVFRSCAPWPPSPISSAERQALFEALLSVSDWVRMYYLWRPNLADEADNHVLELAVAAGATAIITANKRDFARSELLFPGVRVASASEFLDWRRKT